MIWKLTTWFAVGVLVLGCDSADQAGDAACTGPDPSVDGCVDDTDCTGGEKCLVAEGCVSSSCACTESGWECTADCGTRHACGVSTPSACSAPNPAEGSCTTNANCKDGETCQQSALTVCIPSQCSCDAATGEWGCSKDCGNQRCGAP